MEDISQILKQIKYKENIIDTYQPVCQHRGELMFTVKFFKVGSKKAYMEIADLTIQDAKEYCKSSYNYYTTMEVQNEK